MGRKVLKISNSFLYDACHNEESQLNAPRLTVEFRVYKKMSMRIPHVVYKKVESLNEN